MVDLNTPPVGFYARQRLGALVNENFDTIAEHLLVEDAFELEDEESHTLFGGDAPYAVLFIVNTTDDDTAIYRLDTDGTNLVDGDNFAETTSDTDTDVQVDEGAYVVTNETNATKSYEAIALALPAGE